MLLVFPQYPGQRRRHLGVIFLDGFHIPDQMAEIPVLFHLQPFSLQPGVQIQSPVAGKRNRIRLQHPVRQLQVILQILQYPDPVPVHPDKFPVFQPVIPFLPVVPGKNFRQLHPAHLGTVKAHFQQMALQAHTHLYFHAVGHLQRLEFFRHKNFSQTTQLLQPLCQKPENLLLSHQGHTLGSGIIGVEILSQHAFDHLLPPQIPARGGGPGGGIRIEIVLLFSIDPEHPAGYHIPLGRVQIQLKSRLRRKVRLREKILSFYLAHLFQPRQNRLAESRHILIFNEILFLKSLFKKFPELLDFPDILQRDPADFRIPGPARIIPVPGSLNPAAQNRYKPDPILAAFHRHTLIRQLLLHPGDNRTLRIFHR